MTDRDDDLLGYDGLLAEGLTPDEARGVLGPHAAVARQEAQDRLAMLRREHDPMDAARKMLARALPADAPYVREDRP
jgi:hypothetical protein